MKNKPNKNTDYEAELAARKAEKAKERFEKDGKNAEFFIKQLETLMAGFIKDYEINASMTGAERMRLNGAGVRNSGFINKAYDIALENPQYLPREYSVQSFGYAIRDLEESRQIFLLLQQFLKASSDLLLANADAAFRDALRVYNNLHTAANAKDPGADVLFNALYTYFSRKKPRADEAEPSDKELERDAKKLIHGKASGEISIVSEKPRFTGRARKVVDTVHTGHEVVKENAQAEIKE
jgi:hypothetical protein